jgi:D-serine ammonia-lyase
VLPIIDDNEFQKKKMKLKDLPTPAFVINRHAMAKNCQAALNHATRHNLKLRPHIKTHKTMEGALLQLRGLSGCDDEHDDGSDSIFGPKSESSFIVTGFVASTLPEVALLVKAAKKYGERPFHDILFGVPIAKSKLSSLDRLQHKLSAEGGRIHILIDHEQQIQHIEEYRSSRSSTKNDNDDNGSGRSRFTAFLKLDTGYHRAGVPCDHRGVQVAMRMIQSPAVELVGLYSHW